MHGQVNELLDKHMIDKNKMTPKLDVGSLVQMCTETIDILEA